jgi:hypothetical protein
MECFEKLALDLAQHKPSLWLQYVDDTFVVWPHGPERLQDFLSQLNSLRPSIQFTVEIESDSAIAFLDILVIREETTLAAKVYRKPIHNCRYLSFNSNRPPHVKSGLIQSLHNRASTISQERQDLFNEISSLKRDLQLNGYTQGFTGSVINSKASCHLNKEQEPLGSVYVPYVKGVSEKFKLIGNPYNVRTIFKTEHTLKNSLTKTRPEVFWGGEYQPIAKPLSLSTYTEDTTREKRRTCRIAQRSVNFKYSLVLTEMFRFTPASQFVEPYHSAVSCALKMEDLIPNFFFFLNRISNKEISDLF